jgi:hypothetical protein
MTRFDVSVCWAVWRSPLRLRPGMRFGASPDAGETPALLPERGWDANAHWVRWIHRAIHWQGIIAKGSKRVRDPEQK